MNQVIHDVDENEPIPFWRGTSNESVTEDENIVPMLYSIQINLKVLYFMHLRQMVFL